MKKKNYIIIITILAVAILISGVIIIVLLNNNKKTSTSNDFVSMGRYEDDIIDEDDYVFTSYEDYKDKFNSDKLTSEDFKNNNYVLITIPYDSCADSNIKPVDYTIEGDDIDVLVEYEESCGVCAPEYMYFLLKVDKKLTSVDVDIDYKAINDPDCDPNVTYKPLIYLYPEEKTNVTVKLGYPDRLTTTYPKYNTVWEVVASPDGNLIDEQGRTYYGLYWEGLNYIDTDFSDGFVVKKEDTIKFLEEKLSILGLNEREANEFIVYWLPVLEENEYNLIRFESIDVINNQMPLDINPVPDTIIRVLMEYKPLDKKIDIKEQVLTSPERYGFTVVEWGGSLIK